MIDRDTLSDADLEELISDSQLLMCLLEHQVHRWKGYDEAYEMYENLTELKG